MASFLSKILRMGEGRVIRRLEAYARAVDALEDTYRELTDEELRALTDEFKERYEGGESLDSLLPEAFAAVREASGRTLGQRHFFVQMMGGAALHLGNIAEMKTGEGKTLVATLPAYLNALTGKGVHVVTVNDYLASYQSELMGRVFRALGLTTGCITSSLSPFERREQYEADITYGTNNEFGFDYLRDNMAMSAQERVQRGHYFAVVDEVDSILIDEARTPLIISGPAEGDVNKWYTHFAQIASKLKRDTDYEVDEKKRTVGVLEAGIERVEDEIGIENLYESVNTPFIGFLNNAIKAKELFARDKEYIVRGGEVLIVDEHTGRVLPGRRYNEGMHQAIEAKEHVEIKAENQTHATITLQNYFRLYDKLSGMTGTAETEAAEFQSTYKIGVIPIRTNREMIRIDHGDVVYKSEAGKFKAIAADIKERHELGQPVLVGTASVEKSELLSKYLKKAGIAHKVLNAKHHESEASIVAMAGRKYAVTVATNMAGRGTDIMLGGNAEFIAMANLRDKGLDPAQTPKEYEAAWPGELEAVQSAVKAEHDEVVELGGLYVLGSERHESRRIDNQLRGRSGRQGDPGESRFYLSFDDDLLRLFDGGMMRRVRESGDFPEDYPIENSMITRSIASAQTSIEGRNFEIRKNVLKYDDVMSRQREVVYDTRGKILDGADLEKQMRGFLASALEAIIAGHTGEELPEAWDLEALWKDLTNLYPVSLSIEEVVEQAGGREHLSAGYLVEELASDAQLRYDERAEELGETMMRDLERYVLLRVLDRKWREHLYEMDYLKEGIGLRAMGQRDPLVEYKREGYHLFQAMNEAIKEEAVAYVFYSQVTVNAPAQVGQVPEQPQTTVEQAAQAAGVNEEAIEAVRQAMGLQPLAAQQESEAAEDKGRSRGGRRAKQKKRRRR